MDDEDELNAADFVPGAGERRVDQVLDELYDFNRLMSILFAVAVGEFILTFLGLIAPSSLLRLVLWFVLIVILTIASVYRYQLN